MNHKILVIDDSEIARDWGRFTLEDAGFEVRTAETAAEAERAIAQWKPDLVLLDVTLRETTGIDLCRRLKSRLTHLVPIVLMSGRSEEELAGLALACDADGFLSKVSGGQALVERIDEIRRMILW
jgi:DNA-binding response OmpR family regulator